jgi:hypothetical protein
VSFGQEQIPKTQFTGLDFQVLDNGRMCTKSRYRITAASINLLGKDRVGRNAVLFNESFDLDEQDKQDAINKATNRT